MAAVIKFSTEICQLRKVATIECTRKKLPIYEFYRNEAKA